jgi:TRAP transporter TAXI family solute receptor
MRRVICVLVAVTIVTGVLIAGCAPARKAGETVELEMVSFRAGTSTYALSFGLADIVTKNHPWINVTGEEGGGSIANLRLMAENPEKRKTTLFMSHEASNFQARTAMAPFKEAYMDGRAFAAYADGPMWIWTKDKSISKPEDLTGKRVMLGTRGANVAVVYEWLFKRWGVWDTLDVSYGAPGAQVDALTDGLVDALGTPFGVTSVPGGQPPFQMSGLAIKLFSSRPNIGWITVQPEDIETMMRETGYPAITQMLPARTFDKYGGEQPQPIPTWSNVLSWWADKEMDEDIVYEVVKTVYENADKFAVVVGPPGETVTQQGLSRLNVPKELFHPGALKFYKEKGVTVGR